MTAPNPQEGGIIRLKVSRICAYPNQPRQYFDEKALGELGASLGIVQEEAIKVVSLDRHPFLLPLVPEKRQGKVTHMICNGERRWRAARKLDPEGTLEVREIVVQSEAELYRRSLRSNHYNETHSMLEIIRAVQRLTEEYGDPIEVAAECLGMHPVTAQQYLDLASLDPRVLKFMDPALPKHKRLRHKGAATALIGLPPDTQVFLARKIVSLQLTAKTAVRLADGHRGKESGPRRMSGGRPRRPSDELRLLFGLVGTAREKLGEAQEIPGIDRILKLTLPNNRTNLLTELARIQETAKALEERVRAAGEAAAA